MSDRSAWSRLGTPASWRRRAGWLDPVRAAALAVLLVGLLILLFGGAQEEPAPPAPAPAPGEAESEPDEPRDPVEELLAKMPVDRKIAQLFVLGFDGSRAALPTPLRRAGVGGVVLTRDNYANPSQLRSLTGDLEKRARGADAVAPWVLAAQDGGELSAFAGLPPPRPPADVGSPADAARAARATAKALRRAGVTGILGPALDVTTEEGGVLGAGAYSDSADAVVDYAAKTLPAFDRAGVFAAAKRFPGLGGASQSPDDGPAHVGLSLDELRRRDLRPFVEAIELDVPGIVVGHGLYSTDDFVTPASLSSAIVTGLLRDELGFRGVAITDDLASPAINATLPAADAALEALRAGADLVQVSGPPGDQLDAYREVLGAARKGELEGARIDEALRRVIAAKRRYGLIPD